MEISAGKYTMQFQNDGIVLVVYSIYGVWPDGLNIKK